MNAAVFGLTAMSLLLLGASAPSGAVDVHVTTVHASAHGRSDRELLEHRPRLRRLVGYRAFRMVGEERRRCTWQSGEEFAIPGGRQLRVVPQGMRDQAVRLRVQILDGERALVDTDVCLQNRGMMLFGVDQVEGADGEALIIMLKAKR